MTHTKKKKSIIQNQSRTDIDIMSVAEKDIKTIIITAFHTLIKLRQIRYEKILKLNF